MVQAQQCEVCGMFYNAAEYSSCPYCRQKQPKSQKRITGLFGLFRGRVKTGEGRPPEPEKEKEPEYGGDDRTVEPDHGGKKERTETPEDAHEKTEPDQSKERTPEAETADLSLEDAVMQRSRTVGKYISAKDGTVIAPVVGWIVGVKGDNYGRSFPLKSGRNRIGRSYEMDIKLMNDESVSRTCVAVIVYDRKANEFSVLPGESDSLCYLNERAVYDRQLLRGYDLLEFGDSELNQYLFVPLCGEAFRWKQQSEKADSDQAENEESI